MGQFITNFRKPLEQGKNPAKEVLDRSLFDLSPKGQEKIDSIAAWREKSHHSDNVPVVNSPPPPTLVGCAD